MSGVTSVKKSEQIHQLVDQFQLSALESQKMDPESALPYEVFQKILSYLNPPNLQKASAICHKWNMASVDLVRRREYAPTLSFVYCSIKNLGNCYIHQKSDLTAIKKDLKVLITGNIIFTSINIKEVTSSTGALNEKIIHILKTVDDETLKTVEEASNKEKKPQFFKRLVILAGLYQRIDNANGIDVNQGLEANWQGHELRAISRVFAQLGHIAKAIKVANSASPLFRIRTNTGLSDKLKQIALKEVEAGNIRMAIRTLNTAIFVANKITIDGVKETDHYYAMQEKSFALKNISLAFVQLGYPDRAIEVINTMPNEHFRAKALQEVTHAASV